jgi:hypothetical protein
MACKSCHSDTQRLFPSEIAVHFPSGLDTLNKGQILIFPRLLVCLNCGFTEFLFPEADLRQLNDWDSCERQSRDKTSNSISQNG